MTEEEAKTKWCFKYQVGGDSSASDSDNRPMEHVYTDKKWQPTGRIHPVACCIGSACMAWRWHRATSNNPTANALGDMVDSGYCGSAGKP